MVAGGHLISGVSSSPKVKFDNQDDLLLSRLQSLDNELRNSGGAIACCLTIESLAVPLLLYLNRLSYLLKADKELAGKMTAPSTINTAAKSSNRACASILSLCDGCWRSRSK